MCVIKGEVILFYMKHEGLGDQVSISLGFFSAALPFIIGRNIKSYSVSFLTVVALNLKLIYDLNLSSL